jgi:cyclase
MKKRIIPIVLYDGKTVVKGSQFNNERTVGMVEATANLYARRGPDEIFFLDISAGKEKRSPNFEIFEYFATKFDVPFAVGGGISSVEDAKRCVASGAEKVVLGSVALSNPHLIAEISSQLGSQAVVVSVDYWDQEHFVYSNCGLVRTTKTIYEFLFHIQELGAGEILLQDISRDGKMSGLNINMLRPVVESSYVPIIASGGAGTPDHFLDAFEAGASGVAAGAMFQFTKFTPSEVARFLKSKGIDVR